MFLVTGADGFIGRHLCRALKEKGRRVRAMVLPGTKVANLGARPGNRFRSEISDSEPSQGARSEHNGPNYVSDERRGRRPEAEIAAGMDYSDSLLWDEMVEADLRTGLGLEEAARGVEATFHLAALARDYGPEQDFVSSNVDGTRRLLQATRGRIILLSSMAAETHPGSPYGRSKLMQESLVRDSGRPATIVHPGFVVYGPGDRRFTLKWVRALMGGALPWVDGGRHAVSTVYVENLARGLAETLRSQSEGKSLVLSDGNLTWRVFTAAWCRELGVREPRWSLPSALLRLAAPPVEGISALLRVEPLLTRYRARAASLELGVEAGEGLRDNIPLEEGVRRSLRWALGALLAWALAVWPPPAMAAPQAKLHAARTVPESSLSFLSFNAAAFPLRHPKVGARLDALADFLRESGPDVAGLQEVWFEYLAKRLGERAGYSMLRSPGRSIGNGLLLLTKHPILESRFTPFTANTAPHRLLKGDADGIARKGVLSAHLETPWGRLDVHVTHLISDTPPEGQVAVRVAQIYELYRHIRDFSSERPYVLMADMNCAPQEEDCRLAEALLGLKDPCMAEGKDRCEKTFGERRIDYVYFRGPFRAQEAARTLDRPFPGLGLLSDHAAGIALRLLPFKTPRQADGAARAEARAELEGKAKALSEVEERCRGMAAFLEELYQRRRWIPLFNLYFRRWTSFQAAHLKSLAESARAERSRLVGPNAGRGSRRGGSAKL